MSTSDEHQLSPPHKFTTFLTPWSSFGHWKISSKIFSRCLYKVSKCANRFHICKQYFQFGWDVDNSRHRWRQCKHQATKDPDSPLMTYLLCGTFHYYLLFCIWPFVWVWRGNMSGFLFSMEQWVRWIKLNSENCIRETVPTENYQYLTLLYFVYKPAQSKSQKLFSSLFFPVTFLNECWKNTRTSVCPVFEV